MEPKIRIIGFTEKWGTHSIKDIATLKAGKSFNKFDAVEAPLYGYYPCFGGNGLRGYLPYYNKEGKYIIIGRQGALCGCINVAEGKFYATEHAILVTPIVKTNFDFLHELLVRANINQYATGMAQPGISVENINNQLVIALPSYGEQNELGKFFNSFESLIKSTAKKIESLKQVKAASLQAMFPQVGETTPRLRFKGFEGEWKKVKLEECLEISKDRNLDNRYGIHDVLSVSDDEGVCNQIKLLGRSYAGKSVANYKVLKTNQIVYTKSPLKSKPYGIIKVNNGVVGIVSVLYAVYNAKDGVNPDFIHYYFEPCHRINNYLHPLINKGAKNTMNISDEMSLQGEIWIPCSIEEQACIVSYLESVDKQINLHILRLEKLKQIKSACLDNMFV